MKRKVKNLPFFEAFIVGLDFLHRLEHWMFGVGVDALALSNRSINGATPAQCTCHFEALNCTCSTCPGHPALEKEEAPGLMEALQNYSTTALVCEEQSVSFIGKKQTYWE